MYFIIQPPYTTQNNVVHSRVEIEILNNMFGNIKCSILTMDVNWWMKMTMGNRKYLDILYQNIPGILSIEDKRNIILRILSSRNPDALAIAEPLVTEMNFNVDGYKFVKGTINGGKIRLGCFIRKNLDYTVEKWNLDLPTVVIQTGSIKIVFTYREWSKGGDMTTNSLHLQEQRWIQFLNKVSQYQTGEVLIMGDMNYHFWSDQGSPYQAKFDNLRQESWDKLLGRGWRQMVRGETRFQNNQNAACLDHIFCRYPAKVTDVYNLEEHGYDHHLIGVRYRDSNHLIRPELIKIQNIKGIALESFVAQMESLNIHQVYEADTVGDSVDQLVHKVQVALGNLAEVNEVKIMHRCHAKWMTSELLQLKEQRVNLGKIAKQSNSPYDWQLFKNLRNHVQYRMKQREIDWTKEVVEEGIRCGKPWQMVKKVTNDDTSEQLSRLETEEGILESPYEIAEYMNKYFLRKVHRIQAVTPTNPEEAVKYTRAYVGARVIPRMEFTEVDVGYVKRIISNLKNTGSLGVDNISTRVLKQFKEYLCYPLTHIVNKALRDSEYPDKWRQGIVSPIPKKGCLLQPGNWRPVTLLCSMSKILETVMNKQLQDHIKSNGLVPQSQHAYQQSKSAVSAWAELDTFVNNMMDKNRLVGALLLDMSAAFNLVSSDVIIPKLRILGLGDNALKLLKSYLTGRRNLTKIKSYMSSFIDITTGIGEGSVLGPLAFVLTILCLDSVLEIVRSKLASRTGKIVVVGLGEGGDINLFLIVFADDCTPLVAAEDPNDVKLALEIIEEEFTRYFSYNGLKVNQEKCEHIIFSKVPRAADMVINGRAEATFVKLLGLTVSNRYSFERHAANVVARMSHKISYLVKLKKFLPRNLVIRIAEAVSLSVMNYGFEIYGTQLSVQKRVQKGQNQLMRVLLDADRSAEVGTMLTSLGWTNAQITQKMSSVMLLRRIMVTRCSPLCFSLVEQGRLQRNQRYPERPREWRIAWSPTIRMAKKSFLCNAITSFNTSRLYQTGLDNKKEFKSLVKSSLMAQYRNINL